MLSEVRDHEELLRQAVQVASCPEVLQPTEHVPFLTFGLQHPAVVAILSPAVDSQLGSHLLDHHLDQVLFSEKDLLDTLMQ